MLRLLLLPFLLAATAGAASAQIPGMPAPSQEDMRGLMEFARQAMNPAAQVLAHRAELGLTPEQVTALDSIAAPLNRFLDENMLSQSAGASAVSRAMGGGGEIDEEAIRAAYREQADRQAELMIRGLRVERQVAQVLTPEQRTKRQQLQASSVFEMMRAMGAAAATGAP